MTDPISDMLTRIRNSLVAGHEEVQIPFSKVKEEIAKILCGEGFVQAYRSVDLGEKKRGILISLRYVGKKKPAIRSVTRISRPGRRVYSGWQEIPKARDGFGTVIVSTSKGILTDRQARQEKLGGEVLCSIW